MMKAQRPARPNNTGTTVGPSREMPFPLRRPTTIPVTSRFLRSTIAPQSGEAAGARVSYFNKWATALQHEEKSLASERQRCKCPYVTAQGGCRSKLEGLALQSHRVRGTGSDTRRLLDCTQADLEPDEVTIQHWIGCNGSSCTASR